LNEPSDVVGLLNDMTAAGDWGTGWQLSLRTCDGPRLDLAGGVDGAGKPVMSSTRFCVYCAGKPVTALCVGALADLGEISFDDCLGDVLPGIGHPALAAVTVDELLRHTAGLGRSPARLFLAQPSQARDRMLLELEPEVTRQYVTTYSEFAAWELLRMTIEAVAASPFEDVITSTVLEPLGLVDRISFTLLGDASALGLNVAVRPEGIEPLLWEQSETNLCEVKASTGLLASASALADLYSSMSAALDGSGVPTSASTLAAMVTAPAAATFDPVLDRSCKLGAGFMVDLQRHHFGPFSPRSFGHSGLSGMTFAGCDPIHGASFAVHINGFLERDQSTDDRRAETRRESVMTAIAEILTISDHHPELGHAYHDPPRDPDGT